jgi:hypothetical protein
MSSFPLDEVEEPVERKWKVKPKPHIVKKAWGICVSASRNSHVEVFNEHEAEIARQWAKQRAW